MSITKKSFGVLPDGRATDLYTMTNASGASVEITNYGGIIRAINVPDKRPVRYEQMHAIYRDERVPFVCSIISFFQSPVGWLCFALIFFVSFITPFLQKKLQKEKLARMAVFAKKKAPEPKAPPAPK